MANMRLADHTIGHTLDLIALSTSDERKAVAILDDLQVKLIGLVGVSGSQAIVEGQQAIRDAYKQLAALVDVKGIKGHVAEVVKAAITAETHG
jgi:hypothetical protein